MSLYLCSGSESRALLLRNFDVDFVQKSVAYDEEQIRTTIAKDFVYTASKGKLDAATSAWIRQSIPIWASGLTPPASKGVEENSAAICA